MAGVFQGLADYLFGIDPIDDQQRQMMETHLAEQARQYAAREAADYTHQSDYGRMLLDTIHGQTPSVAGLQLGQGLDAIQRQGQSAVAGASGNNAALTGYGALLSTGGMAAQFEQAKAIQRAQEIQATQAQYGALLNNMGQRSAGLMGTTLGTGLGYGQLGTEIQSANQKAQATSQGALLGAIATGISAYSAAGKPKSGEGGDGGTTVNTSALQRNPYSDAMPGYEASNINYGQALSPADSPQDPYQASYSDGLYRGPSVDRGYR